MLGRHERECEEQLYELMEFWRRRVEAEYVVLAEVSPQCM
jgi:hypothetical protein